MLILTISIITLTLLLAFMAYIAIWSRNPTNARWIALACLLPITALSIGSIGVNLGIPTWCVPGYTLPAGKLTVLGFKVVKDDTIYLLLDTKAKEPLSCQIPYSSGTAKQLQEGKRSGQGTEVEGAKGPPKGKSGVFGNGLGKLEVHPKPVDALPPKAPEEDAVQL